VTAASWSVRSYAKVNLHLEVAGRRPDGFHDLVTVFQTVSLADRVHLEYRASSSLDLDAVVTGPMAEGVPVDRRNLAVRALCAFAEAAGLSGHFRLQLIKRIPAGGGLGGGSSNAATVLGLLARAFPHRASAEVLHGIAAGLGSDVAYFLVGGSAVGRGRGELLDPLPELPRRSLWLVLPPVSSATPRVFGALEPHEVGSQKDAVAAIFGGGDRWKSLVEHGCNALTGPALRVYPQLAAIEREVAGSGVDWVRLSGSGSTFIVGAGRDWGAVARRLGVGRVVRVRTVSRRELAREWSIFPGTGDRGTDQGFRDANRHGDRSRHAGRSP
jgi:4-diphosphocytidyl-2-C-methyl-D-erythritol kinase